MLGYPSTLARRLSYSGRPLSMIASARPLRLITEEQGTGNGGFLLDNKELLLQPRKRLSGGHYL
jgi:hypothetical protein